MPAPMTSTQRWTGWPASRTTSRPAARFLMLTAITHHKFSSPAWEEHEVRKLHAELAELDRLVTQAVVPGSARITRTK